MRIKLTSIMVNDQDRALKFTPRCLAFRRNKRYPLARTGGSPVVSPEGPDDLELSLEPNANPAGKAFQEAMLAQGIPLTAFEVADIEKEYARLKALGVVFTREPAKAGPVTIAVFADTCGNLIQLYQPPS